MIDPIGTMELKPCPFCGSAATRDPEYLPWVGCPNTECVIYGNEWIEEDAWNRRVHGADPGQPAADRFIHGFAYALANLVRLHGDATEARDLWKESGYKRKDFETAGVDEYDMETLRGLEWLK